MDLIEDSQFLEEDLQYLKANREFQFGSAMKSNSKHSYKNLLNLFRKTKANFRFKQKVSYKYFTDYVVQHDNKPSRKCAYMLFQYDAKKTNTENVMIEVKTSGPILKDFENAVITNDDDSMVITLGRQIPDLPTFFSGK